MIWKKQPVGSKLADLQNNKASKDTATQSAAGLMSASDKTKLDGIAAGATAVSVVNNLNSDSTTSALSAAQGKALNSKIDNITPTIPGTTSADSNSTTIQYPAGKSKSNLFPIAVGFYHNTNWVFNGNSCQLSLTNSNIVLELSSGFEYFRGLSFVILYR